MNNRRSHVHNVAVVKARLKKKIKLERGSSPWPLQRIAKNVFLNQENLRVHSSGMIQIKVSDPRSLL